MHQETSKAFDKALQLLQANRSQESCAILAEILTHDPNNERAWHMLSYALSDPEKQIYALQKVLQINPQNRAAKSQLNRLSVAPPAPVFTLPRETQRALRAQEPIHKVKKPPEPQPQPRPSSPAVAAVSHNLGQPYRIQQSGSVAQAAIPAGKILPFPGTMAKPLVKYNFWQRIGVRARLSWRRFRMDWEVFAQSRLAVVGLIIIAIFGLMAVAHSILLKTIWPSGIYDPITGFDMNVSPHPSLSGPGHVLGTDTLGRDVLSMLLAATTPTFLVGLTAALTTAILGTVLSVTAAYFRGAADAVITNLADVFLLFPAPIIMVIIGARFKTLGPVPLGIIYGLVIGAGPTTIVMRAHALQVVSRPYMEAAKIAGGGAIHMIVKHMLPAMLPLAALQMMIAVTGAVVADGFISFFVNRSSESSFINWGTMIYDAFVYSEIGSSTGNMWHMLLPAALCFSLFALGFYLVSRGLHRVASPTIREERI